MPEGGAQGVLVANADFIGGFALWVDSEGLLHHTYSLLAADLGGGVLDEIAAAPIEEKERAQQQRRIAGRGDR